MQHVAQSRHRSAASLEQPDANGFTLLELLVVVAILALLAGIVFASMQSMRQAGAKASTTSGLRSVYTAVILYAQENNNLLPGPVYSGISASYPTKTYPALARRLAPYLTETIHTESGWFQVEELEPLNYPALARRYDEVIRGPAYVVNTDIFSDPTYSSPLGYPPQSGKPAVPPKKLVTIPRPSKDVLLFGLDANNLNGTPGWADRVARQPLFGNQRPFLYWDGHVEISEQLRPEPPGS
jgi:prepilin-type N-terminal cleavage/methylation domain-containing protein/prepilin-type processing-associated H-X9-DG protein